ncbi:hypothetical protein P153DRAFT_369854 [Dothidotthia symphoricarpi CBS 119687]|uniref:SMP domain-containing protein n=1 Tax=Dothidotthia symphoricarpi CBS 119687 TaxID=1392245 RepID=A0A6A6A220_9PLEO|nr:uncharacterized protein P153DRAFT_369854 [Dothidotthia symphoricarpi CBS 119687]KAF2125850.1 hypothetical protein P153DRAFT_369854 [Dothidotthia symphoricarpi CBS 119687]
MASKFLRLARPATHISARPFSSCSRLSILVTSDLLSQITAAEKRITKQDEPVKNGPTARAQSHVGSELTRQVVHDITEGEKSITGRDGPMQGGPTSIVQAILTRASPQAGSRGQNTTSASTSNSSSTSASGANEQHTGKLDSETISKITDAEKKLTGEDGAVSGGPTAKAQQHANEPITSEALSDITAGEKSITGGERVKGGPTSVAQSELGKSRS